jgi:hypothetical protein
MSADHDRDDDREAVVAALVAAHGRRCADRGRSGGSSWTEDDGGPVQVVYLVAFRDVAQYPPEGDEPERTGAEAFFLAGQALVEVINDVGGTPLLGGFPTQQLVDDDGERWDYVGAARYPSRAAFVALWQDPRSIDGGRHRRAGTRRHRVIVTRPLY